MASLQNEAAHRGFSARNDLSQRMSKSLAGYESLFARKPQSRQAERLAKADAEALIRDHGAQAYGEARQRERDVILPDGTTHAGRTPAHWRRDRTYHLRARGDEGGIATAKS